MGAAAAQTRRHMKRLFCLTQSVLPNIITQTGFAVLCYRHHPRVHTNEMIRITARGDEPLEKLMRRFKKKCEKEGLIRDIKRITHYEKPSDRRRRKEKNSSKARVRGF